MTTSYNYNEAVFIGAQPNALDKERLYNFVAMQAILKLHTSPMKCDNELRASSSRHVLLKNKLAHHGNLENV